MCVCEWVSEWVVLTHKLCFSGLHTENGARGDKLVIFQIIGGGGGAMV